MSSHDTQQGITLYPLSRSSFKNQCVREEWGREWIVIGSEKTDQYFGVLTVEKRSSCTAPLASYSYLFVLEVSRREFDPCDRE